MESLADFERAGVERGMNFLAYENAYAREHASRTATIGLVLSTNPLALLAWQVLLVMPSLYLLTSTGSARSSWSGRTRSLQ